VPQETRSALEARGVELHVARTGEAVETFNRLARECADVVAAFHLTC
jgi:hypothetical protein